MKNLFHPRLPLVKGWGCFLRFWDEVEYIWWTGRGQTNKQKTDFDWSVNAHLSFQSCFSEHGKRILKQDEYLWPVGKWEGCPGCDDLSSAEKITKTWMWTNTPNTYLWTIQILNHVAFCHKHVCKDVRKVDIANLPIWVKDCWVLWARCFSFEVS